MREYSLLWEASTFEMLRFAWEDVAAKHGMPGVDQVSIKRFGRKWEENLIKLSAQLRNNIYQPHPLRVRWIPKRNRRELRELGIPTVRDRIVQRAVLEVLYPIYEPMFLDCSFGYRPGIGLRNAVTRILVLRENGWRWVLDADIDDFFNQVPHNLLLRFLEDDLPDQSLLQIISRWLKVSSRNEREAKGIPIGSPVSPLFANIVLHRFDLHLTQAGFPVVRYADDFLVFTRDEDQLSLAYQFAKEGMDDLALRFEPHKTRLTSFDQGFGFIGVDFFSDSYEYVWENKRIEVEGNEADPLFSQYGPDY